MGNKTKIQVLVVRPGEAPVVEEHLNDLDSQQKLVEGYIEAVGFGDNLYMTCNEEGKLKGLTPNFCLPNDIILGTVFFCRVDDEGECASLDAMEVKRLTAVVLQGRQFLARMGGGGRD